MAKVFKIEASEAAWLVPTDGSLSDEGLDKEPAVGREVVLAEDFKNAAKKLSSAKFIMSRVAGFAVSLLNDKKDPDVKKFMELLDALAKGMFIMTDEEAEEKESESS